MDTATLGWAAVIAVALSWLGTVLWAATLFRQVRLSRNQVRETQQRAALIKRDFDQAMAAYQHSEAAREMGVEQMNALRQEAETRLATLEAQREAQARDLDRLRVEIAERPKVRTQPYKIVVIGVRSTGKTSLILKWANPVWEIRNPPGATMFNKFSRTVSSVSHLKSNVVVNHVFEIFDFGGERLVEAQETLVVEDIHGLLFVVDLGVDGSDKVDEARVRQQTEAFSAQSLQFFFRAPRIVKTCQTVVLFINKSDLLSGTPKEVEAMARAKYSKLIEALQTFSEQVEIEVLVGSGHSGHNTHMLMPHFVQKLLPEDAYDEQLQQRAQGLD